MIVRLLSGRVPADKLETFHEQARLALESARQNAGLLYGEMGRQIHSDCSEDVVFVTAWRDLEALYAWIGGNDLLWTPILGDGDAGVFARLEVQHYETWDDARGEWGAQVPDDPAGERDVEREEIAG